LDEAELRDNCEVADCERGIVVRTRFIDVWCCLTRLHTICMHCTSRT